MEQSLVPIRNLTCNCCGQRTRGRQWHDRDTGFGICVPCANRYHNIPIGATSPENGVRGYHFDVPEVAGIEIGSTIHVSGVVVGADSADNTVTLQVHNWSRIA